MYHYCALKCKKILSLAILKPAQWSLQAFQPSLIETAEVEPDQKQKRPLWDKNRRISSKPTFLFLPKLWWWSSGSSPWAHFTIFFLGSLYWKVLWNNFLGFCCYKSSSESKINVRSCFELPPTMTTATPTTTTTTATTTTPTTSL